MPMLAAMAAPNSMARAEDVVMSVSPLTLTGVLEDPGNPGCGSTAPDCARHGGGRSRGIGKPARWSRLGLAGVRRLRIWTGRRCSIHGQVLLASLLACRGLQPAFTLRRSCCQRRGQVFPLQIFPFMS